MSTHDLFLTTVPGIEDVVERELDRITALADLDRCDETLPPTKSHGHVFCRFRGCGEKIVESLRRMRSIHHINRIHDVFDLPDEDPLDYVRSRMQTIDLPVMTDASSFRVTSERKGKHAFTSMQVAQAAGGVLWKRFETPVELEDFDLEVHVDVYDTACLVHTRQTKTSLSQRGDRVFLPRIGIQPSLAYGLLDFLEPRHTSGTILDPFCGSGTILLEIAHRFPDAIIEGGEADHKTFEGAQSNVDALSLSEGITISWGRAQNVNKRHQPHTIDAIVTNPPFGVGLGGDLNFYCLYRDFLSSAYDVLKPDGRIVMLVLEKGSSEPSCVTTRPGV